MDVGRYPGWRPPTANPEKRSREYAIGGTDIMSSLYGVLRKFPVCATFVASFIISVTLAGQTKEAFKSNLIVYKLRMLGPLYATCERLTNNLNIPLNELDSV